MKISKAICLFSTLFIIIVACLLVSCASNSQRPSKILVTPQEQSHQEIELKGRVELILTGSATSLPLPILKSEEGLYILNVTPQSSLPPEMSANGMVEWRPGAGYKVKGYLTGAKGTTWNSEKQKKEEVPVLYVLSITKL